MSKRFSLTAALLLASALVGPASAQPTDPDARAAATLAQMTQDEKLSML